MESPRLGTRSARGQAACPAASARGRARPRLRIRPRSSRVPGCGSARGKAASPAADPPAVKPRPWPRIRPRPSRVLSCGVAASPNASSPRPQKRGVAATLRPGARTHRYAPPEPVLKLQLPERRYALPRTGDVVVAQRWGDGASTGAAQWDAGVAVARLVDAEGPERWRGRRVLELSAGGGGVVAVAALRAGAIYAATDADAAVLALLQENVARNAAAARFKGTFALRWGDDHAAALDALGGPLDVVVVCGPRGSFFFHLRGAIPYEPRRRRPFLADEPPRRRGDQLRTSRRVPAGPVSDRASSSPRRPVSDEPRCRRGDPIRTNRPRRPVSDEPR